MARRTERRRSALQAVLNGVLETGYRKAPRWWHARRYQHPGPPRGTSGACPGAALPSDACHGSGGIVPGAGAEPEKNEIKTCLPFLFRQIEIICPPVICTMGTQSSQILLHSKKSLFQLRGRFYNFNDLCSEELTSKIVLMPSLHPSLLLHRPIP